MGNLLACVEDMPEIQRMKYDMTPLKTNKLPIIWLVGPPGSGRNTQGETMAEHLKYDNIRVAELLRNESMKETERGRIVKNYLGSTKRVPDTIVIDLIKEEMLGRAKDAEGFILNGFPRSSKQSLLFVKEIANVDVVIYLYSHTNDMISRVQQKRGTALSPESIKKDIITYMRETKEGTSKFSTKLERVYTDAPVTDVYKKIEAALNMRVQVPKIGTIQATSKLSVISDP